MIFTREILTLTSSGVLQHQHIRLKVLHLKVVEARAVGMFSASQIQKMGLNAYRFLISWSRILPGGKLSLGTNQEGIDYYNNLIDELLSNGIEPYVIQLDN